MKFREPPSFGVEDIKEALTEMGHELTVVSTPLFLERASEEFDKLFEEQITGQHYDAVFSFNYSAAVSTNCNRHNIPYISWIYDSPLLTLYSYTITNPAITYSYSTVNNIYSLRMGE